MSCFSVHLRFLAGFAVLLLAGCSSRSSRPACTLSRERGSESFRVLCGDKVLCTLTPSHKQASFTVPSKDEWKNVRLEVLAPEGWRNVPWVARADQEGSEQQNGEPKDIVCDTVALKRVKVYVDNLNGPAQKLVCGELQFDIAANERVKVEFPRARPEKFPLRLDAQELGPLTGNVYLVDTLGNRSYELSTVPYGTFPSTIARRSTQYKDRFMHELAEDVSCFFKAAPDSIETINGRPTSLTVLKYWH
jgi:hypothetical protein